MDVMSSRLCECPARPGPAFTRERRGPASAPLKAAHGVQYIYLRPSVAYKTVAHFARDEGRHLSVKEHALRRGLVEEGVLEAEDGHTALRISIGNRQQRPLWLHRSPVEKLRGLSPQTSV